MDSADLDLRDKHQAKQSTPYDWHDWGEEEDEIYEPWERELDDGIFSND